MKTQKISFLLITLFLFGLSGHAADPTVPQRAPSRTISNTPEMCKNCRELKALEAEFIAVKTLQDGAGIVYKVADYLEKARPGFLTKAFNREEFDAYVRVAAAADPFDIETTVAADLDGLITSSKALKAEYKSALKSVEACRAYDLSFKINERQCSDGNSKVGCDQKYELPSGCGGFLHY